MPWPPAQTMLGWYSLGKEARQELSDISGMVTHCRTWGKCPVAGDRYKVRSGWTRVRTPAGLGLGQPASEVGPRRGPGAVPLTLPQQTPAGHGARSSRDWALGGDADGANGIGLHGRLI